MTKYFDRTKTAVSGTPGTGQIVPAAAISGFRTFAAAGAATGDIISYTVEDGSSWEVGRGTIGSDGAIARAPIMTSAGNNTPLTLSSAAIVYSTMLAADAFSKTDFIVAAFAIGQTNGTRDQNSIYSKNVANAQINNDATITLIFTTPVPRGCLPVAAGTFNPYPNNEGMICEFCRNTGHTPQDDVNWMTNICLGFKDLANSTSTYALPTSFAFAMLNPAI